MFTVKPQKKGSLEIFVVAPGFESVVILLLHCPCVGLSYLEASVASFKCVGRAFFVVSDDFRLT